MRQKTGNGTLVSLNCPVALLHAFAFIHLSFQRIITRDGLPIEDKVVGPVQCSEYLHKEKRILFCG